MRLILACLFSFALIAPAQAAPQKFALIVANSDYDGDAKVDASENAVRLARERGYVGDLANPWFDSVRVKEALTRAGFTVETFYNADNAMITGGLARLRARASAAGPDAATLFYYSGHAVQIGGLNFLVGARTKVSDLNDVTPENQTRTGFRLGVSLQMMLAGARQPAAPGYDLLLIDACRDNPWEESVRAALKAQGRDYAGERAYGALSPPSRRTIIGFSAAPGQFATDGLAAASSPFANAIARRAAQPGLPIDQLLQGVSGEVAAATAADQIPTVVGRLGDSTALAP